MQVGARRCLVCDCEGTMRLEALLTPATVEALVDG